MLRIAGACLCLVRWPFRHRGCLEAHLLIAPAVDQTNSVARGMFTRSTSSTVKTAGTSGRHLSCGSGKDPYSLSRGDLHLKEVRCVISDLEAGIAGRSSKGQPS